MTFEVQQFVVENPLLNYLEWRQPMYLTFTLRLYLKLSRLVSACNQEVPGLNLGQATSCLM
jgi:hypothetical protein